jgi:hypothetical protein
LIYHIVVRHFALPPKSKYVAQLLRKEVAHCIIALGFINIAPLSITEKGRNSPRVLAFEFEENMEEIRAHPIESQVLLDQLN